MPRKTYRKRVSASTFPDSWDRYHMWFGDRRHPEKLEKFRAVWFEHRARLIQQFKKDFPPEIENYPFDRTISAAQEYFDKHPKPPTEEN